MLVAVRQLRRRAARIPLPARTALLVGAGAFALVFAQSLRRHLAFGSTGKDLGLFHQTHWLLSRLEAPLNTVMGMHAFADHLELVDLVLAPLQWLWPSAVALLAVQAAAVASGAAAIADLGAHRLRSAAAGAALGLSFVLAVEVQDAVMFDWNPTTVGAGLLPWVVWAFVRGRRGAFVLAVTAVAVCKENLVLYAAAVCLALALGPRAADPQPGGPAAGTGEEPLSRRAALVAAAAMAVLFVVEMKLVFPLFRPEGFRHLRYEQLGGSAGAILGAVATHPWRALGLLVTPGEKVDVLVATLGGAMLLPLVAPRWLLPMGVIVAERLWSTAPSRWWGYHYGAALGALAALAALEGIALLAARVAPARRLAVVRTLAAGVLASTLLVPWALPGRAAAPLLALHLGYDRKPDECADARRALAAVPPGLSVAAQNQLIPHLAARRSITELSRPVRAEVVALHLGQGAWPFADDYPAELGRELRASGYGAVACFGKAVVLRRGAPDGPCPALDGPSGALERAHEPGGPGGVDGSPRQRL